MRDLGGEGEGEIDPVVENQLVRLIAVEEESAGSVEVEVGSEGRVEGLVSSSESESPGASYSPTPPKISSSSSS